MLAHEARNKVEKPKGGTEGDREGNNKDIESFEGVIGDYRVKKRDHGR